MKKIITLLMMISVVCTTKIYAQSNSSDAAVEPTTSAPEPPSRDNADVVSIFSGELGKLEGVNFDPNWNQSTDATEITIDGDIVLKYENFNYQGIELNTSIDVSEMDFLHVDLWTSDANAINMYLISPGPSETPKALAPEKNKWVSYDIPLSVYSDIVDLTEVFQFKFDDAGQGNAPPIYISNLYFYRGAESVSTDASLANLKVNGESLADFSSSKLEYTVSLAQGTSEVPDVTVTSKDENAEIEVTPASDLPGTTSILVTAEDGETTQTYSVNFTLLTSVSDATLSSLTVSGEALSGFTPNTFNYEYEVETNVNTAPEVVALTNQDGAEVTVMDASAIPGHTVIKVVSEDESNTFYYSVFFKSENLLWSDEFTDPVVNTDYWEFEIGDGCEQGLCGWGNGELQVYREGNVSIQEIPGEEGNNAMVIQAESTGETSFASGRVKTEDKVDIKFGRIEVRMQVPDLETGLWPAAWMIGSNNDEVGWPQSGELDLMEMGHKDVFRSEQGHANTTENQFTGANVFWYTEDACTSGNATCAASIAGDTGYNKPYASLTDMSTRFQIYRMYWTDEEIRFTVEDEGVERNLYEAPFPIDSQELNEIFSKKFYFILNMAVGGDLTDASSASEVTAPLPGKMYVDYVRVHKLNGLGEVTLGGLTTSNEAEVAEELPGNVKLYQNYPNPFNPSTQILYELKNASEVKLKVSDMLGRTVAVLQNGRKNAGTHTVSFKASNLSSGVYFYSLIIDQRVAEVKRMMLIK
jgi:beta-glucanase (GH16 family)